MLYDLLKITKRYSQNIKEELQRLKDSKRDIYMFGGILGGMSLGSEVRRFLDKNGIEIKGHIANKAFITKDTYCDKPIYALEDNALPKDIAIVIGMIGVKQRIKELKSYGYSDFYFFNIIRDHYYGSSDFESYFLDNEIAFEKTYNLLADDLSKQVMQGYLKDRIYNNYDLLAQTQDQKGYFNDLMKFGENEVMIDCGAYDGDTALEFIKACPNYSKVYAFEPENENYEKLLRNTQNHRVECIPKGAYSSNTILRFHSGNDTGGGKISDYGTIEIPVCTIDSVVMGGGSNIYKNGYRRI